MIQCKDSILARLRAMPGDVSLYYKNLTTGETMEYQADHSLIAASVIKLALLGEMFRRFDAGEMDPDEMVTLRDSDKAPGCGVLANLHEGLQVTLRDLCVLMATLSDNTATNLLFDRVGAEAINRFLSERGLSALDFNRKMFDEEAAARGVQNHITAAGVGLLLEKLARGELVSASADMKMMSILLDQQINHKIPFYLGDYAIAHKTGEDDGTTHDAAIVLAPQPFVLCMFSNHTDVPAFNRLMQDVARELVAEQEAQQAE